MCYLWVQLQRLRQALQTSQAERDTARLDKELLARGMKSRIVLQVHDELLVETWEPELADVMEILEEKMKGAASLRVALEVEAHSGNTWLDAK